MARRRKKRRDKADNQQQHAKQRFMERFGVPICHETYKDMVAQIQGGKAQFISRQSNRISKFWVTYNGQQVPVVYDKLRGTIVTVLKPEWVAPCP